MRLAIFNLKNDNGKIAANPEKVVITQHKDTTSKKTMTVIKGFADGVAIEIADTFEEAVEEVASAWDEVIVKFKGPSPPVAMCPADAIEELVDELEAVVAEAFPCTECADGIAELHPYLYCRKPSDNTLMRVYQCDRCRRIHTPGLLVNAADSEIIWRGESVEDRRKRRPVTAKEVADVVNRVPDPPTPRAKYCDKCGDEIDPKSEWYYTDEDHRHASIVCSKCVLADSETLHNRSADPPPVDANFDGVDEYVETAVTLPHDPLFITICKDGGEREEVTFHDLDPSTVTAAELNAVLRKAGYDASMVSAMTPLSMLENAERRATQAVKQCEKAQRREQTWVDWFEEIRMKYDGVMTDPISTPKPALRLDTWKGLEEHFPWPSLEDERAQALQDE